MLPWPSRGPKGMPRPWHPTHGACHALDMLPLPLRHPACPQGPCCLRPGACQRAHASMPRPWLLHARPGLGCCVLAQALDAACSPKPCLLSAHGGLPWPRCRQASEFITHRKVTVSGPKGRHARNIFEFNLSQNYVTPGCLTRDVDGVRW